MILPCGFVQANALNLGVLPMIVHPALCCGRHCFYMRCCRVFSGLLIVPLFGYSRKLTKPCLSGDFDPSGSHQLPIAGSDGDPFLLTLRT